MAKNYPDSWTLWDCVSEPRAVPEFYRAPQVWSETEDYERCWKPDEDVCRARTRAGLIAFIVRTGKWLYAYMVTR